MWVYAVMSDLLLRVCSRESVNYHHVRRLLQVMEETDEEIDLALTDEDGLTALHHSTTLKDARVLRLLLTKGADVNSGAGDRKWTPLMTAARAGNSRTTSVLLDARADPAAQNVFGWSALSIALHGHVARSENHNYTDHVEVALTLIAAGSDVDQADHNEINPLMLAAQAGTCHVVRSLLAAGASINRQDERDWTALLYAYSYRHQECFDTLLSSGASTELSDSNGRTTLFWATFNRSTYYIEALIHAGAVVRNELVAACERGHPEVVACLVRCGVDVNRQTRLYGMSALMAISNVKNHASEHMDCISTLLAAGPKIELTCRGGHTALSYAVRYRHPYLVFALIRAGADVSRALTLSIKDAAVVDVQTVSLLRRACYHAAHKKLAHTELATVLLVEDFGALPRPPLWFLWSRQTHGTFLYQERRRAKAVFFALAPALPQELVEIIVGHVVLNGFPNVFTTRSSLVAPARRGRTATAAR